MNPHHELGDRDDLLRIVDESGEDYLYHKSYFIVVDFPREMEYAFLAAQGGNVLASRNR